MRREALRRWLLALLAYALLAYALLAYAHLYADLYAPATPGTRTALRHCLVLTQDPALQPVRLTRSLTCVPFVAAPFTTQHFSMVSVPGQAKLRDWRLLHSSADLSNNASVNIFVNHLRIWQHVADVLRSPTLVLEEDTVLRASVVPSLEQLLHLLQRDGVSNYVVKLHDNNPLGIALQWSRHYRIEQHAVRKCSCRPHHVASSCAAYMLDPPAAHSLLRNAHPLHMHVDVYQFFLGCVYGILNMYALSPNAVAGHTRPSIHWRGSNRWLRAYLLAVETVENWRAGTCGLASTHPAT